MQSRSPLHRRFRLLVEWRERALQGLLAAGLLLPALLLCRPAWKLAWFPLSEDGYYSLAVARNIALGRGLTADGLHVTNGFQPLFTFLCVLPYTITSGDRQSTLRIIIALHYGLYVGAAWLFATSMRILIPSSKKHETLYAAMFCASTPLYIHFFNGLETGMVLFLILLIVVIASKATQWSASHVVIVGGLAGALVLARIDTTIFVGLVAVAMLVTPHLLWRRRLLLATAIAGMAAVVSLPWWLFNEIVFDSPIPTSAQQQIRLALSGGRLALAAGTAGNAAANTGYPEYFGDYHTALRYAVGISLAIVAVAVWRRSEADRAGIAWPKRVWSICANGIASPGRQVALAVIAFAVVLIPVYGIGSMAIHFYPRYLAVWCLVGLAWACWLTTQRSRGAALLTSGLCAVWIASQIGIRAFHYEYQARNFYFDQVELVRQWVPSGVRVGAFQSGTLGYFLDGIVNLDGKVNAEALVARRDGHVREYLRRQKIDWLCDWRGLLQAELGPHLEIEWEIIAERDRTVLLKRRSNALQFERRLTDTEQSICHVRRKRAPTNVRLVSDRRLDPTIARLL